MADKPKKRRRKAKEIVKPKKSLRERNKKAASAKEKPKRVRKTASTVKNTVGWSNRYFELLNTYVIPRKNKDSFLHKTRRITPSYFVKSMAELKHVTWPGRKETWKLVFCCILYFR